MSSTLLVCGIRVQQASSPASQRSTHLVTCLRTGASALVDPFPETRGDVLGWLEDPTVKLRYELHTRLWSQGDSQHARLEGLQSRLGLRPRESAPEAPAPWLDTIHAVVAPVAGDDEHTTYVRVGATVLAVPVGGQDLVSQRRFTLVSTPPEVPMMRVGSLRIALGAFHVSVLPVAGHSDRVAYHVADRLFFPGTLRAGAAREPADGLSDALLDLASDTIVYVPQAHHHVTVSTVGVERVLAAQRHAHHVSDLDDDTLEELAGLRMS